MVSAVFCLMGPTASGKTALACELSKRFPFEIISVDSAMIYRGMDIGTAKPDADEQACAPHHLIDILDPPEFYSAFSFCEDVNRCCEQIFLRGKIPLLTGGTMMYFRALQQGLSTLPNANEALRTKILKKEKEHGLAYLHGQLIKIDPSSAAKIHPNDSQRIQRALEVYYLTGQPMSLLHQKVSPSLPYSFVNLILMPIERQWLHKRIAQRFDMMLKLGFLDEVVTLLKQWQLTLNHPSMRSVGYRQAYSYLKNEYDSSVFYEKGIAATRQLAKRQLTWLRHWPDGHFFAADNKSMPDEIMALTKKILDNT